MAERGVPHYPPVGDPDRLDSIMTRGRSLRRRRQLGAATAGAGGALAVVVAALVFMGGGSDRPQDRAVADDGTTTTTTTTTTTPPPSLDVELIQGPPAQIRVVDPEQPDGEGTGQCITVSAYEQDAPPDAYAVAEGTMCAPGISAGGTSIALVPETSSEAGTGPGAEVGGDLGTGSRANISCAASVVSDPPEAVNGTATRYGATTFTISAPDVPPGTYRVEVLAVSGIGDGCPPEEPGAERENSVVEEGSLRLP
jgi:hypothetical protein